MHKKKNLVTSKQKRELPSKKRIAIAVIIIVFAFSGSFLIYFVLQLALNTQTPMVVVVSNSMEPNINKGDLLFLRGVADPADIKSGTIEDMDGDVIVYDARGLWSGAPDDPIVHRVVAKWYDGEKWWFLTKGDNNAYPDRAPVPEDHVIGIVVGRIPYIGYIKIFLTGTGLLIPLIVLLSVLLIISIIWDLIKEEDEKGKKPKKEKFPLMSSRKIKIGAFREEESKEEVAQDDTTEEEEYLDKIETIDDEDDDFDF